MSCNHPQVQSAFSLCQSICCQPHPEHSEPPQLAKEAAGCKEELGFSPLSLVDAALGCHTWGPPPSTLIPVWPFFTLEVLTQETSSSEKLFPIPQACQINIQGLPVPSEENKAKSGQGTEGLCVISHSNLFVLYVYDCLAACVYALPMEARKGR